ncbi:MAG: hypothetical protein AUI45_11330 [Acidobacteria bacterium 13_1_40CM_2_56_11]|nr:MAG: hypothetical protein AUI45_11330 [Acidobacteria bacterium 13_1_40CM_2_56_11]
MSSQPSGSISVDIGAVGVLQFTAVPETRVTLDSLSLQVSSEDTTVDIKGSHVSLPTDHPLDANLFWSVRYEDGTTTEFKVEGSLHFPQPSRFEFLERRADNTEGRPVLKVFDHRLFGKGKVCVRLEVKYPHCKPALLEPGQITFDNAFIVEVRTAQGTSSLGVLDTPRIPARVSIGAPLYLSLSTTGVAARYMGGTGSFKLSIREIDEGKGEVPSNEGVREQVIWPEGPARTLRTHVYRVGCELQPEQAFAIFNYQESNERGEFELAYSMAVAKQGDAYQELVTDRLWLLTSRPRLTSFSLRFEGSAEDGKPSPRLVASGTIEGFDAQVVIKLELALFRKVRGVLSRFGTPSFAFAAGGHFDVEIYRFADADDGAPDELLKFIQDFRVPSKRPAAEPPVLFAALRFAEDTVSSKGPLSRSFDWDARTFAALDAKEALCAQAVARWVCSSEAKTGYTSIVALQKRMRGQMEYEQDPQFEGTRPMILRHAGRTITISVGGETKSVDIDDFMWNWEPEKRNAVGSNDKYRQAWRGILLGSPPPTPEATDLSIELQDAPDAPTPELRVLSWLEKYQPNIAKAERTWGVDRRAIAGAIAWEALWNPHKSYYGPLGRFRGAGKVHDTDLEHRVYDDNIMEPPTDWSLAKELEMSGVINPIRTEDQRKQYLSTVDGSLEYIGAAMHEFIRIARQSGYDLNCDLPILAFFFNARTLKKARKSFETKRAPEKLHWVDNQMAPWVKNNMPFLEKAVGKPETPLCSGDAPYSEP